MRIFHRLVLPTLLLSVSSLCAAADPAAVDVPPSGSAELVNSLLEKIRNGYDAVRSGEYTLKERVVETFPGGTRGTAELEMRCVFDRRAGLLRYEYRRPKNVLELNRTFHLEMEKLSKPTNPKEVEGFRAKRVALDRAMAKQLVSSETMEPRTIRVTTPTESVMWEGGGLITIQPSNSIPPRDHVPFDVMAAGLFAPSEIHAKWSFAEFWKFLEELRSLGHVTSTIDGDKQELVLQYTAGKVEWVRRTTFDVTKGLVATRTELSRKGSPPADRPISVAVKWENVGGVLVPIHIDSFDSDPVYSSERQVEISWKNVNQAVSSDEFDYHTFGARVGTLVIDTRVNKDQPVVIESIGERSAREIVQQLPTVPRSSRLSVILWLNGFVVLAIVLWYAIRAKKRFEPK